MLIVENGSRVANANSYISVADADAYAESIGNPNGWSGRPALVDLLYGATNFADTNSIIVNGKTYTFQAVLTDVNGNVFIGATLEATLQNLRDALDLTGTPGTQYAASMTKHATVTADVPASGLMRFSARLQGTAANAFAVSIPAGPDGVEWDGDTFQGGTTRTRIVDKEAALIRATNFLDGKFGPRFRGSKIDWEQSLEWPRIGAKDDSNLSYDSDEIPKALKNATAELAISTLDAGQPELAPNVDEDAPIIRTRSKVGPLEDETEYGAGGLEPGRRTFQRMENLLRQLIFASGQFWRA